MKSTMKRFLSVLLAAALLCGLLAIVPASAAESNTLTVKTTSNFFAPSETTFTVNGDTYVYVDFKLAAADKLLVNADIRGLTYDPAVLEWKEEYNTIGEGREAKLHFFAAADELGVTSIVRKTADGRIIGNFSSVTTPIYADNEDGSPITVVTAVFKVLDPNAGTTTVDCNVNYMALCDADKSASPEVQYQAVANYTKNQSIDFINTGSEVTAEQDLFNGQTLSLEGDIAVNFYLNLTDEQIAQGAEVDFTWYNKSDSVALSSGDLKENGYKATCHVAPAEMKYPITVKVSVNGKQMRQTLKYSVCDYADYILSDTYQEDTGMESEQYDLLVDLVRSMLDYGTRAQEAFDRTDAGLANGGEDYLDYNALSPGDLQPQQVHTNRDKLSDYGLEYYNSTIVYLTKVTIRHYYTVTDWDKFNAVASGVAFGGKSVNFKKSGSMVYFDYAGVDAVDSSTPYLLQIGDYSFSYSVYDYIALCLNAQGMKETTKKLVTATYYFSKAANEYFEFIS